MAKSRLLSCAAHGRKKTDELPVFFSGWDGHLRHDPYDDI